MDPTPVDVLNHEIVQQDSKQTADPCTLIANKLEIDDSICDELNPLLQGDVSKIPKLEQHREALEFVDRIIAIAGLPKNYSQYADLIWSKWRCVFAGFGHSMHADIVKRIIAEYPYCPWEADDTQREWLEEAISARNACGLSLAILQLPWPAVCKAYPDAVGSPPGYDTLSDVAAVIELARYARRRIRSDKLEFTWVGPRGLLALPTPENKTLAQGLLRDRGSLLPILHLRPTDRRLTVPEHHLPTVSMNRLLARVYPEDLAAMKSPRRLSQQMLVSPFPTRNGAVADGLIPVDAGMRGVWELQYKNNLVSVTPKEADITLLETDWPAVPFADADIKGQEEYCMRIAAIKPARALQYPHVHVAEAFPNIECPIADDMAYAAVFDSLMIFPFMDHGVTTEYPLIYVTPHDPTVEGATNTGKTTLAEGLTRVFAPTARATRINDTGAPGMRAFAAGIISRGTACVDEFVADGLTASHPLNDANLFALSTGGQIGAGQVFSNKEHPASLRYPLVLSAKVVYGRRDTYNRAFKLNMSRITNGNYSTYTNVRSGQWSFDLSIDCRLLARELMADSIRAAIALPTSGDYWRMPVHRAIAAVLVSRRASITLEAAATKVDTAMAEMADALTTSVSMSALNGLTATSEDSSGVNSMSVLSMFSDEMFSDDAFQCLAAMKELTVGQVLEEAVNQNKNCTHIGDVFVAAYGKSFATSKRNASVSMNKALRRELPNVGDAKPLHGVRGLNGWVLERMADRDRYSRFALTNPKALASSLGVDKNIFPIQHPVPMPMQGHKIVAPDRI